jgi:hypothetical protein
MTLNAGVGQGVVREADKADEVDKLIMLMKLIS